MLTVRAIPGGFFVVSYSSLYKFLGQQAKGNNMKTTTMSKETRKSAENLDALIDMLHVTDFSKRLIRSLVEEYGDKREKDGIAHGKSVAGQERREEYLATASYYEQRNKELMSDILAVISEHRRTEVDDDIPF